MKRHTDDTTIAPDIRSYSRLALSAFLYMSVVVALPAAGKFSLQLPLGLRPDSFHVPADNPLTQEKIDLGRLLFFFDVRLSADNSLACATCHAPEKAFTDNSRVSTGIDGRQGSRNAPTIINRIAGLEQFHDGRAATLEQQAKGPIINPLEMDMRPPGAGVEIEQAELQDIAGFLIRQKSRSSPRILMR
jgi:cytochrome c peroxidase